MENSWIQTRLASYSGLPFFRSQQFAWSYTDLLIALEKWRIDLRAYNLQSGQVVGLVGEFSPQTIAALLALLINKNIVVPLDRSTPGERSTHLTTAQANAYLEIGADERIHLHQLAGQARHPLLRQLREAGEAGIVLFTSGSTGKSKATVLQVSKLLARYNQGKPKPKRMLIFLKLDHIGGINSLFSGLFNGGTLVTAPSREAIDICATIERFAVELLPATPTFLNMLLLSGHHREYDLSCLRQITYGTEVMPQATLKASVDAFPEVVLKQTYGLTELGILSTRSRASDSTWLQLGLGVEKKVVAGVLWLRSQTAMLGYLNAAQPFDSQGWYNTEDHVEMDGTYLRFIGRESERINVGGEKVYPTEVEHVLLEIENIREALVYGKANPVTGQVVNALVVLKKPQTRQRVHKQIVAHCKQRLARYKIPVLVEISEKSLMGHRLKQQRKIPPAAQEGGF